MASSMKRSSGNVFEDVGFTPKEAEHLRIRSDLMIEIGKLISDLGLTQTAAAALFGVSQPRISDIVRGKIELFSIDALIEMLGRAGVSIQFTTSRREVA